MALVVFLRGVNVGGHKTFRPSVYARELSAYEVVNVGAAGTFVVWNPGDIAKFRAEILRKLPFSTEIVWCDGRDLIRLTKENPFGTEPSRPDVVRFVSILVEADGVRPPLPIALPTEGEWLVRLIASDKQFVFGEYRRHMKTIGYLGQIDRLCGARATTRNWNTIMAIVRILKSREAASE
jgi:uncharacterized protein (DUF1697 family)